MFPHTPKDKSAFREVRLGFYLENLRGVPLAVCAVEKQPLPRIHRFQKRMLLEMTPEIFLRLLQVGDFLFTRRVESLH